MFEEMRNLIEQHGGHVMWRLHAAIERAKLIYRHGDKLGVYPSFVRHFQHTERPAAHDYAGD